MFFNDLTPRESAQFQGFKLAVPQFFDGADGDSLLASFAANGIPPSVVATILHQTVGVEGTRNNVSKAIKEKVIAPALAELVGADPTRFASLQGDLPALCRIDANGTIILTWDGRIESLPDDVKSYLADNCTAAAQKEADNYFQTYSPMAPRRKGVSGPSLDPVEDQARKIFADSIYATWEKASFKDADGKVWTGVKSHDRAGSAHQAANLILSSGQIPAFMEQTIFEKFDGEIGTVKQYVEAYTELLFSSDRPAGQAKVARLREMAAEQLGRASAEAKSSTEVDELLGA